MTNPEHNDNYEEFYFDIGDEIKSEDDARNPRIDYVLDAINGSHSTDSLETKTPSGTQTAFDMLYGDPSSMDLDMQRNYPLSMLYGGWPEELAERGRQKFNDMGVEKILEIFDTTTMSSDQLDSLPAILQTDFLAQEAVDTLLHRLENMAFEINFNNCDVRKMSEALLRAIPLLSIMGYLTRVEQQKLLVNLEKAEFEDMIAANDMSEESNED